MLTELKCKNATCPTGKNRKRFTDSAGLYLEVSPAGSRRWFVKTYALGKESRLALGSYPSVTLKAARAARDDARKVRQSGANPVQQRRLAKIAAKVSSVTTYEAVAREFHAAKASGWSATHAKQWLRCQEKDAFPWIGALPLRDITAPTLLDALRKVESRGATQLVRDLREFAGQVFTYGIASGRCENNPARDLLGALKAHTVTHHAAVLEPAKIGQLMRAIAAYQGQPTTRAALALSAMLFQRPGNIRQLEWAWLDLDKAMLTIPAASMKRRKEGKAGRPHLVPLSKQAVATLRDVHALTGHGGQYVFPSVRGAGRPMSENTLNAALRGMGYASDEASAHGFRAMALTTMAENLEGIDREVIEVQLAHAKGGPLGAAYDRAEYVDRRRALMQVWSDYLDTLRDGAQVIPIRAA